MELNQQIHKNIYIEATPSKVWAALTRPGLMQQWMSETEIDIITSWKVGSPFVIRGALYKKGFENKGLVLAFEPDRHIAYSHLSSLSRLPDEPESYTVIDFKLKTVEGGTMLNLNLSNFPTETIYKHLAFYWNGTLHILKKFVEAL